MTTTLNPILASWGVTQENADFIAHVADVIEQDQLPYVRLDMSDWLAVDDCGTSACIAGYAYLLFMAQDSSLNATGGTVERVAIDAMGLRQVRTQGGQMLSDALFVAKTYLKHSPEDRREAASALRNILQGKRPWTGDPLPAFGEEFRAE